MVDLPKNLLSFKSEAEKCDIQEIEFASSTYQVLVSDKTKECWVFLQLEGKGEIKDIFCSCEEENESCKHMAAAYLGIFGPYSLPLHQRFVKSLWHHLCQIYSDHLGDDPTVLIEQKPGSYLYKTNQNRTLFEFKAKTPSAIERIEKYIKNRVKETEETSLKFSNLSEEEILLWQEGRPSSQLRYHLSYWSDLAKWLLQLQELEKDYSITFNYTKQKIPFWIQIDFEELEMGFFLPETKLAQIIPSLATVKTPLQVHFGNQQGISSISYSKEKGILQIESEEIYSKKKLKKKGENEIALEGWTYIPEEGFYSDEPHALIQNPLLEGDELAQALTEFGPLISGFLVDYEIHLDPILPSYQLWFDKNWNLHIKYYLFNEGDLNKEYSRLIGDWVFLESDGFYHLKERKFNDVETTIPLYQVSEFVNQNRTWLNSQEGFHTHLRSLEYQLSYTVTPNQRLNFIKILGKFKGSPNLQDFGTWIYLEGHGFYPKTISAYGMHIKPGLSLGPEQVPLFIKMNRDELSLVHGFFCPICPIVMMNLKLELLENLSILLTPQYELIPEFQDKTITLFEDFVYIEGEGFYELPLEIRLPEKFRKKIELEKEERDHFLLHELAEIRKFISYLDPRLDLSKNYSLVTTHVEAFKEKGRGWYKLKLFYKNEKGQISVIDLWEKIKKKQTLSFEASGLIDLKDKQYDWIRHLKKDRIDTNEGTILLTALEFMRLNAYDPIHLADEKSKTIYEELTQLKTPEKPDIGGLLSHLRPYQEIGVNWLWFLYQQQLSGLLCDDMGLGKTHQAMGLLTSIHNLYQVFAEGIRKQFLIVCPTSVIYHWQEKLQEFLPSLKVYTFYGAKRTLDDFKGEYDILLTSYGIARNEYEVLSKISFEVAIFDEIQIAKNQSSRVYAALNQLKAQMKIGLTGTPIENYLRELKSLFDIVLPGYMPGEMEYRETFIKPIEKEGNQHRKDLLNRLITPFILRRKKEDVLTDLPDKIEEISHCDLLSHQRELYMDILQQRRKHLLQDLQEKISPIPYMHIFALLSSLKQICDHPAVFLKKPEDYKQYDSGKWELFLELLREARESKQKVVVFSQYLAMLDIIESYLTENDIGFSSLRGATQNRKDQIARFNQDPTCEVFVGSLQAAGLGIDLTAGSVVIHYDRWWNAARENQATDRVHRIGQTRGVQVFKLVTKNTFEEKIDLMIQRKGQLMEDVIGVDDHTTLKKFTREELIDLLSFNEREEEHPSISDVE